MAIVRNLGCYLSRETKKNILHAAPSCSEPAATRRFVKILPVLVRLPSYLNALIASFRIHPACSGPPGATVNRKLARGR